MDLTVPAVSVVTIVKNNEELLPRAVNSVLSQRFTDYEHIIVNDGSTDATINIIDGYAAKDKRVLPIHLSQNVGRALARNTAMEKANGRYIFFLDSDDYLPDTSLNDLIEVAEENNADVVYGRIKSFDSLTGIWRPNFYTDRIIDSEKHNVRLDDHLNLVDNHQIVGRLFRKEFLQLNNIKFSTVRRNAEDVLFSFFTAFHAKNLSMVPQKTVYYYNFGNQLQKVNEAKLLDARDNILDTIKFALKFGSDSLKKRMIQKGVIFAGNLFRAQEVYDGDQEKFIIYITSLVPFVENIPHDYLADLPLDYLNIRDAELAELRLYYQRFANALQSKNFDLANFLWSQRNSDARKTLEFERLRLENRKLASELDAVYRSRSWRITAPFRRIKLKFIKNSVYGKE